MLCSRYALCMFNRCADERYVAKYKRVVVICIVDYGAGNLQSVANILEKIGVSYQIAENGEQLGNAEKIIFPGVGHFGQMCTAIDARGLRQAIASKVQEGIPFLGICLGMHLLFDRSTESPEDRGLGIFSGTIRKFDRGPRIPHMGWNSLDLAKNSKIFPEDLNKAWGYFAHSYFCPVVTETVATTEHGTRFSAIVERENIFGVQFHPEKSAALGEQIVRLFVDIPC